MNDDRQNGRRPGDGEEALGAALGEAVARETESPIAPPPVTDITERAAARAKARQVRHGVVSIAAAAALVAVGLAAWNTLGSDGDGNIQVATRPTMPEPIAAEPAERVGGQPDRAAAEQPEKAAGESDPAAGGGSAAGAAADEDAGADQRDGRPGGDSATIPPTETDGDRIAPAGLQPTDPPAVDPGGGAARPAPTSAAAASSLPSPTEISTGPALAWTEVSVDLGAGPTDAVELTSLGDGRVVAAARGPGGDRLALTADGASWSGVELPDGASFPYRFATAGDRWVIAIDAWDPLTEPPTADTTRVLVSDDGGGTWNELELDAEPARALPPHCEQRSAVQDVLASRKRVVVLVALHRFLDIEAILAGRGLIEAGTPATEWRRTGDTLTVRLGDPAEWDLRDDDQVLHVALSELGLTPEQLEDCDGYASGRVVVLAGDGSAVSRVAEHRGGVSSAVATEDGFAMVIVDGTGTRRLTSGDGLGWVEVATGEAGYGQAVRGHDGSVWHAEDRNGLAISRGAVGAAPRLVARFETLQPVGVLSAGPAGVAVAAWALPEEIRGLIGANTFTKDGYELRLDADGMVLWDLAADVAIHEFSAEQMQSDEPPEGVREERGDDGSVSVAFDDPATGEELVRFSEQDLTPDTDALTAARTRLFGPTGVPPIWIGWSAVGERWGWQDAAEAFGLAAGEGLTPVSLAVGSDFVLARFSSFEVAEAMALAESPDAESSQSGPPSSWRARWFIAGVP